jgi:hypothetical protein
MFRQKNIESCELMNGLILMMNLTGRQRRLSPVSHDQPVGDRRNGNSFIRACIRIVERRRTEASSPILGSTTGRDESGIFLLMPQHIRSHNLRNRLRGEAGD